MATLSILSGWRPQVHLLVGIRFLACYMIGAFAVALPVLFATIAILKLLGADWFAGVEIDGELKIIASFLGLPIAAAALAGPKILNRPQD